MKKAILPIVYFGLLIASTSMAVAPTGDFEVAEGHSIAFKSDHPSGKFTDISGDVTYSSGSPTDATFNLKIPVIVLIGIIPVSIIYFHLHSVVIRGFTKSKHAYLVTLLQLLTLWK